MNKRYKETGLLSRCSDCATGLGFDLLFGQEFLFVFEVSKLALGPNQAPIQLVSGVFFFARIKVAGV
jgi:hypothetical protein